MSRGAAALVALALVWPACPDDAAARAPAPRPVRPPLRCAGAAAASGVDTSAGTVAGAPEIATGFASEDVVVSRTVMAVTANPVASRVACEVLVRGGSAVDAAVAAQMVLNLVEPQSSGIGGGAFLVHYDAKTRAVSTYDGRETAPAAASEDYLRWIDATDRATPLPTPRASGRAIGVPGAVAMLALAHRDHGRLPWKSLFAPAIALATDGFRIGPRMSASIESVRTGLARDAEAAAYLLGGDGHAKPSGTLLTNPALAGTLAAIANDGPRAFYEGDVARAIVERVDASTDASSRPVTPGRMTTDDLAAYRALRRDPVCAPYRAYVVCSMGPPSSGGIAVEATLGILQSFDLASLKPDAVDRDGGRPNADAVHLIAEAERLAYADRDKYVADADFVPLPGGSSARLLDPAYLRSRAALIDPAHSMGRAQAGDLGATLGTAATAEHGTTHLVIADADGDVVSMTTTVESAFGSFHFVRGFALNNQLTDFAANPVDASGAPVANRVAGGKRPRSSMAPVLVFRRDAKATNALGDFVLATGSAGGQVIIMYVVKTLVAALDWGLDPQQAVATIDFGALNTPTTFVGGEHPQVDRSEDGAHDPLVTTLRARGHTVSVSPHSSGLTMLMRTTVDGRPGWAGGADPRREGVAIGDVPATTTATPDPTRSRTPAAPEATPR